MSSASAPAWRAVHVAVAAAAASGALVAAGILGFQGARRRRRVARVKESIPEAGEGHEALRLTEYGAASDIFHPSKEDQQSAALAARARRGDYDEDLILEQLARNRVFLGDDGLRALRAAFVVVVGCGGVGSHAAAALARSGVGALRLVDFDQVTLSSLNRHAVATLADVGTPKVHALRRRLEQVVPWTRFDCVNDVFRAPTPALLLRPDGSPPSFVVDAIDNIDSKVALLRLCAARNLPVVSSMGAACKSDPTRLHVGDVSATTDDGLALATRRRLRALGVASGVPCVYSSERAGPGKAELLPVPEETAAQGDVEQLAVLPQFRVRILPVLGTMPALFGLAAANHVMLSLARYPHDYRPTKVRPKLYDGIHGALQGLEERCARHARAAEAPDRTADPVVGLRLPVTVGEVGYVVEEVWGGRSVVSGLPTRLVVARWEPPGSERGWLDESVEGQKRSSVRLDELVCFTKEEVARHEKEVLKGAKSAEEVWGPDVAERVGRKMEEEREVRRAMERAAGRGF
ncbi:moeb/ThiF domain-containing protein [Lineolata rhizophorae]|uniref:Moeb/ThiF domain-containing protein n=1 Tax=Lineolata rhizophorae TaxID=578093 RepID=A0A6A6NY98_9PEZI|nr:moeb/ThiF domain-containing protein [Lineolata rhizophorae]